MAEKITTRQSLPAFIEQVTVASNLDEGIYMYSINNGNKILTKRMIVTD